MKKIECLCGLLLFMLLAPAQAGAQAQRTFVSGLGNDSNPCNRTSPCRTFGTAIGQTNAGGEVYVLDTAGYGPFAINKSITINAPKGVIAGISVFSGDGIDINVGSSDTVILRGLTVNNQGSRGNGIALNSSGTVHVEGCVVNGFSGDGITSGIGIQWLGDTGKLEVKDSIFRGNATGIYILGFSLSTGVLQCLVDQVRFEGNVVGLYVQDGPKVTVRNSLASNNDEGFKANSISRAVEVNIESCVASNNGTGISIFGGSTIMPIVRISNSTVTENSFGLDNSMGLLLSRGNNTVEGNGTNTRGPIGFYTPK